MEAQRDIDWKEPTLVLPGILWAARRGAETLRPPWDCEPPGSQWYYQTRANSDLLGLLLTELPKEGKDCLDFLFSVSPENPKPKIYYLSLLFS